MKNINAKMISINAKMKSINVKIISINAKMKSKKGWSKTNENANPLP